VLFKPRKVRGVVRSPSSYAHSPVRVKKSVRTVEETPMRRKEVFVEIPVLSRKVTRTRRAVRETTADLVEQIAKVTMTDNSNTTPSSAPKTSLEGLLKTCSNSEVQPFSIFLASPILSSIIVPDATSLSSIQKLGEASYSEVFSLTLATERPPIVMKVIPLFDDALLRPDERSEVELPDCSAPQDVLREIEITRKMAGLPGGGFVDFLG